MIFDYKNKIKCLFIVMSKYPKISDEDFQEKINNIYKNFKVKKSSQDLDDICHPKKYKLQLPQQFLAEFINFSAIPSALFIESYIN